MVPRQHCLLTQIALKSRNLLQLHHFRGTHPLLPLLRSARANGACLVAAR